MNKPRNPVAKHMNEFNKPKTFRNRKKKAKFDGDFGDKPKHRPYEREHLNYHYLVDEGVDSEEDLADMSADELKEWYRLNDLPWPPYVLEDE